MSDPEAAADQDGKPTVEETDASLPTDAPAPGAVTLPPIRIHHLMLWTALSAVLMAASQMRQMQAVYQSLWMVSGVVYYLAAAACLTVLILRWSWRRSLGLRFTEPGHVIAWLIVIRFLFWLPSTVIFAQRVSGASNRGIDYSTLPWIEQVLLTYAQLAGGFVVGVVSLIVAFRIQERWVWKGFFLAKPLLAIMGRVVNMFLVRWLPLLGGQGGNLGWYYLTQLWPGAVGLALLVFACLLDKKQRHWTHWVGVSAAVIPEVTKQVSIIVGITTGAFDAD